MSRYILLLRTPVFSKAMFDGWRIGPKRGSTLTDTHLRGETGSNLRLAQRRADWVKQALISRGIAESRVKVSAGWESCTPSVPNQ